MFCEATVLCLYVTHRYVTAHCDNSDNVDVKVVLL